MSTPLPPNLQIQILNSPQHAKPLARVKFNAFKHNPLNAQMYPITSNIPGTLAWLEEREHRTLPSTKHTTIAIVDTSTDEILARATWTIPPRLSPRQHLDIQERNQVSETEGQSLPEYPTGSNIPLLNLFRDVLQQQKEKHYDAETDYYLGALYTDPKHQGRGLATMLLSWGIQQAEENSARIYLEGAPLARRLYVKLGWRDIELYPIDLAEYGGQGVYNVHMMERLPASGVPE